MIASSDSGEQTCTFPGIVLIQDHGDTEFISELRKNLSHGHHSSIISILNHWHATLHGSAVLRFRDDIKNSGFRFQKHDAKCDATSILICRNKLRRSTLAVETQNLRMAVVIESRRMSRLCTFG
jgi:hypothetical protein